jgi:hypothetical protein
LNLNQGRKREVGRARFFAGLSFFSCTTVVDRETQFDLIYCEYISADDNGCNSYFSGERSSFGDLLELE